MDLAEIARRYYAALEIEHRIGARTFRLRMPTRHERRKLIAVAAPAVIDQGREPTAAEKLEIAQELLSRALIGWEGVTVRDVLGTEAADDPLPWSVEAVALLLAARDDWAAELQAALTDAMQRRNAPIEADEKN